MHRERVKKGARATGGSLNAQPTRSRRSQYWGRPAGSQPQPPRAIRVCEAGVITRLHVRRAFFIRGDRGPFLDSERGFLEKYREKEKIHNMNRVGLLDRPLWPT